VNALVEGHQKAREKSEKPDEYQSKLNRVKLNIQISRNYDENVNWLTEVIHKVEFETYPGILKVLKKYEKHLTKVIDMSSSISDSD
jgi:hypothetical protein